MMTPLSSLPCILVVFTLLMGDSFQRENHRFYQNMLVPPHYKLEIPTIYLSDEYGGRNWVQVLCNAGVAAELSLLYLLDIGSGERPVDLRTDYRASWLSLAVLGEVPWLLGWRPAPVPVADINQRSYLKVENIFMHYTIVRNRKYSLIPVCL